MKFVNTMTAATWVVMVLTLSACSSKMQLPEAGQKVALVPTEQYVPRQKLDENKVLVAHEAKENPYLATKSKIAKGSVLLFIEAKKAKRAGKLDVAEQKLKVITKQDKELSGPWVMLGEIAVEKKQYKQAEEAFQKAILINPDNINAYVALAKVQRLMGEFHVAQNTLALALKVWPDFPEAHLNLGILYDLYLNEPKKAQMHMEAYLFLNKYKNKQAIAWYQEVQGRTGIQNSFIMEGVTTSTTEQLIAIGGDE